ncbi:hypothetical protein JTE90_017180 [Oedothorax gibbosus]|uniref:Uncharacterized protein n=1 Tax=Oedothorax gibbosus TaxID=931172 RepID=A0AAV6V787_9ARAC|nr:hypothetical protein JTE90_017180 [Oedothorax gibbosus]
MGPLCAGEGGVLGRMRGGAPSVRYRGFVVRGQSVATLPLEIRIKISRFKYRQGGCSLRDIAKKWRLAEPIGVGILFCPHF